MSYVPSPGNITDAHRDLLAWIGPDADRDTAAVALSVHHEMRHMSRSIRTAILALFPEPKQPEMVPFHDWLPPVVHEDQADTGDVERILQGLRGL
jgi:hypothetical protein